MRRKDREVTDFNEIIDIIHRCDVLRLGMVDNGMPYVIPLNFGFDVTDNQLTLYFHAALEGRKNNILKVNPNVCFEMDCSFELKRDEAACKWSAYFESVVGYATAEQIIDATEKKIAMDNIMQHYGFPGTPDYGPNTFARTVLFKLTVTEIAGKRNTK